MAAFEALLDLHEGEDSTEKTVERFRRRLVTILAESNPHLETMLNKWTEELYNLRSRVVHGDEVPTLTFTGNPNVEIPHINFGIRCYLLSFCHELSELDWLEATVIDDWNRQDLLRLLWSEVELLTMIRSTLVSLKDAAPFAEYPEQLNELYVWIAEYMRFREEAALEDPTDPVSYKKAGSENLKGMAEQLRHLLGLKIVVSHKEAPIREQIGMHIENGDPVDRFALILDHICG